MFADFGLLKPWVDKDFGCKVVMTNGRFEQRYLGSRGFFSLGWASHFRFFGVS